MNEENVHRDARFVCLDKIQLQRKLPEETLFIHCYEPVRILICSMHRAMKTSKSSSMKIWSIKVENLFYWTKCWQN